MDRRTKLDVLAYWEGNQYRYPQIAALARDVLAIPVTTIASESAFSNSGRVLDQYRSSLKPDVVEALVCARDWLFDAHGMIIIFGFNFMHSTIMHLFFIDELFLFFYRCKQFGRG